MAGNFFYVYALKDTRQNPAKTFYVGKGTGSRANDHIIHVSGRTKKDNRIREIRAKGKEPSVVILCDDLPEHEALRIEAELIATFGTEENGGFLTNTIIPNSHIESSSNNINIPDGSVEKAQIGLSLLKDGIREFLRVNPQGVTNSEAAGALGLRSDHQGSQKDYLSYSILGLLLREKEIDKKGRKYFLE